MKKTIIPFIITLAISIGAAYYSSSYILKQLTDFPEYSTKPIIEVSTLRESILKLFFICFLYFFSLISFPFLLKYILSLIKFKKNEWWKALIGFEVACILLGYVATPGDIASLILFFTICQPIVLVNMLVIYINLKRLHPNQ